MTETYTLYGSYASYYTAKVRSYLRKKGIPFVERLPSDPMFRNRVRPASGSHRIPQLMTPQGDVIQDSVQILDTLESLHPELPAFPATPRQRVFVHLMELLGSEGLVRLAWQHRWLFPENLAFVKMDFGRSFRPQGTDEDLLHYGNLIAERMMSYGLPPTSEQIRADLDAQYVRLLVLFESHLTEHPYLLGGHPSAADYAIMGAFHAHLGRDPAGLRVMQEHAPRVFRWVENMLLPEVQAPEFFHVPVAYPTEDLVPPTALALLRHIGDEFGVPFVLGCLAFNQAMSRGAPQPGETLDADNDQPTLAAETVRYAGEERTHAASVHGVWLAQRAQRCFGDLNDTAQAAVRTMLGDGVLRDLVSLPVVTVLERRNNRLVVA